MGVDETNHQESILIHSHGRMRARQSYRSWVRVRAGIFSSCFCFLAPGDRFLFLSPFGAAGADSHFVRVLFEAPLGLPTYLIFRGARNCSVVKWSGKCGVIGTHVIFSCQYSRWKRSGTDLFIAESMAFIICAPTHKRNNAAVLQ